MLCSSFSIDFYLSSWLPESFFFFPTLFTGTVEESSAVIKNNDHHLKTCILNEVLEKIPIFDSYRNFCETVGQSAMDYPDFEFWYYRFYHGKMDFNYDRNMDPVPKTIMDMPVKLMRKITENLDPLTRTYFRSMNKSIKDVVDSQPPMACKFHTFLFWNLNDVLFEFCEEETGCTIHIPNKPRIKSDEDYVKMGLEYLTLLFQITKIEANHISLSWLDRITPTPENPWPVKIHAKSVKLNVSDMDQAFLFLSALNPGELESINLETHYERKRDQILRIFETEQFKQAKHVHMNALLNEEDLTSFGHLNSFKCELDFLEPVDFQRIREIISRFKQFLSCELKLSTVVDDFQLRTIAAALGAEIPFGPLLNTITHRYQIPESNDFLEFKIEEQQFHYIIKIVKF